ncbi:PREDICTED: exportin-5-like [Priapulus caudatus]|uniref:Exportin-5-like n=1 Tax=Priapulus caudatus TaxID=37621 RepID=A0ABM1E6I8_PRICU|nr:PREDICTED: exportin-5-like [Priapulus caudatus]
MTESLQDTAKKLIQAVETVMNPEVPQHERLQAHQIVENFRESSTVCAQCGIFLAEKTHSHIIRHFGLQLIEHCIKFRWNSISQEEKVFIKENTMRLLSTGTSDLITEYSHIKDGLSKLVVEMIKREWPQQWPSLLSELNEICQQGESQTELVLLIFLRLVEDIVAFQNVVGKRRRDLYQALTCSMAEIFAFFLGVLMTQTEKYHAHKLGTEPDSDQRALVHCRVAQAALMTLAGFVDWVPMSHISAENNQLLQMLCLLLGDDHLQLCAAECLLLLVSRKGKVEDRKPLLILFSEDAMNTVLCAARSAAMKALDEQNYLFLKRLCQVLTSIGSQLCALWGFSEDVHQPQNFAKYLDAILEFTNHPSQTLSGYTLSLWSSFFRHEFISKDPVLLSVLPKVVESATHNLIRVGFPSQSNSPACSYASLDFDSDDDFNQFFARFRAEAAEMLRLATLLHPQVTFDLAARWLETQLQKPIDIGEGADSDNGGSESGMCSYSSPTFLEWDALTVFLESVMSRILSSDKEKPAAERGILLLKSVLLYDTQDPLILSCVLSCISALFIFLTLAPDTLPAVLDKIFSSVLFSLPGQTKATRSRSVKNVRRHACSSLVKICKQYPTLLLPAFDHLYSHIKQISRDPDQLSQMEKCTLMEALILISNQLKDFSRQQTFIEEILAPVHKIWLDPELKQVFWSVERFISYIGLDRQPVEPSQDDQNGINRSQIIYCINTILAVIKRSKWPDDAEEAKAGAFVIGTSDSGAPILRNPASSHIMPLMQNMLGLLSSFNRMWVPEFLGRRSPEFGHAYELPETEKMALLGITPPCSDQLDTISMKHPLERMQTFLTNVHDNGCLAACVSSLVGRCRSDSRVFIVNAHLYFNCCHDVRYVLYFQIIYCINTILAVIKRSKWPDDAEEAKAGAFVIGTSDSGAPILRNPASSHIMPLMQNMLGLLSSFNRMWVPEFLGRRSPEFGHAYELPETEKMALLGITPPCSDQLDTISMKHPLERMQTFLTNVHDNGYHILGNAGSSLGFQFYSTEGLADLLLGTVFTSLDSIPDYRLRPIIRIFLKPFVQHCPKECYSKVLLPVLCVVCPYLLHRLSGKWQAINQRYETSGDNEDDMPESQEVLEDQIIRQLTRDYIDFIGVMCQNRKTPDPANCEMLEEDAATVTPAHDDSLSDLGLLIAHTETIGSPVILFVFYALCVNDATTCNKTVPLCWPLLKQCLVDRSLSADGAMNLLRYVILGLQQHGQHEACQSQLLGLGLQAYEGMRQVFPVIRTLLLQITSCTEAALQAFDEKLLQAMPTKQLPEKKKKDMFKKLVSDIIGHNIGQQFRKEVHIRNLAPLFKSSRPRAAPVPEEEKYTGLCELFKPPV